MLRKSSLGFRTDALLFRLLVALIAGRDLLLFANYLFVPAGQGLQASGDYARAPSRDGGRRRQRSSAQHGCGMPHG